jgi:hypothetical protein
MRICVLLVIAACTGELEGIDNDTPDTVDDNASLKPADCKYSPNGDPVPSACFNDKGDHNDQCRFPEADQTLLRFADGTPTGFVLDKAKLKNNGTVDETEKDRVCGDQELHLDPQEFVIATIDGVKTRLVFHRGGAGYDPAKNAKYGFVRLGDLARGPDVAKTTSRANGLECAASTNPATEGHYVITPATVPEKMTYRKSNYADCVKTADDPAKCTNGWESYGDPGFDQGDFAPHERYSYTPLLWNFVNVQGGGVERSVLAPGSVFHRCNVRSITWPAYSDDGKREIGWVKGVYGKTRQGDDWLYGWIVHSHFCDPNAPECAAAPGEGKHVRTYSDAGVPLHQYWNPTVGDHHYTITRNDAGLAAFGYTYEGAIAKVRGAKEGGTVPLCRYWSPGATDHLITTDCTKAPLAFFGYDAERAPEMWVNPTQVPGTVPLYRYWNASIGDHYMTTVRNDAGLAGFGYAFERIEAYVLPN